MNYRSIIVFTYLILSSILIISCESKERYYRPDEPEQICAICIIDMDDTIYYDTFDTWKPHDSVYNPRRIYFEKSFQNEYVDNLNHLENFSFRISSEDESLITDHRNTPEKKLEFIIPDEIKFESGRKYYIHAEDEYAAGIKAECIVPELPPSIIVTGVRTGFELVDYLDYDLTDTDIYTRRSTEISFSFLNQHPESYYAILLSGSFSNSRVEWSPGWGTNLLNFNIPETNTDGFFYHLKGRKTVEKFYKQYKDTTEAGYVYFRYGLFDIYKDVNAYFIDGSKIQGNVCSITMNTTWDPTINVPYFIKCFRIRIMSIPKELFLFQKSLLTYSKVSGDPFSEPVNLKGNIINGNGIFALCRSRDFIVYTGQQGGAFDPWF